MKLIKILPLTALTALFVGCSSPDNSLYWWGDGSANYQTIVYDYYNEEGNWASQESRLNEIISKAQAKNKKVAPGVYGHLGLVLLKQGKTAEAQQAFTQEKTLFPESAQFIDFLQRNKAKR